MTTPFFLPTAHQALDTAYPALPCGLDHGLAQHPLFTRAALEALAARLPASHVEHSIGDVPVNQDPAATKIVPMTAADVVRTIDTNRCWMVMKKVEYLPEYAQLLENLLADIADLLTPVTGPIIRPESFVFLSAPGSVTPFHIDPEHNILLQIEGSKTMNVFPADNREMVPQLAHEAFHRGAHRNLMYREEFEAQAQSFPLSPGNAVYVPVKAPHWVQNGPTVSVSFSITWRSQLSDGEARLHLVNHQLRKLGLQPAVPGERPIADQTKVNMHRGFKAVTHGIKRALGRQPDRTAY
jgi:Cupin-like domain